MQIAVNTAMSFPETFPTAAIFATVPIAAPVEPNAVIGTAIASGELKPNNGLRMKDNFPPIHGRIPTPSFADPV